VDVSDYLQHFISFCICCCCYTTAIPGPHSLRDFSTTFHRTLPTSSCYLRDAYHHLRHTHPVSTILQASLVLPSLNSIFNCLCGCNARLPPRTYSISHPLGVFVLPFCAPTPWISLHRLARRLNRLGNYRRRLLPHSGTSEVIPISRAYIARRRH
jgi:hypothetical protein